MTTPPIRQELRRLYDEAAAEDRERVDQVLAKEPVERRLLTNPQLVKFLQDRRPQDRAASPATGSPNGP